MASNVGSKNYTDRQSLTPVSSEKKDGAKLLTESVMDKARTKIKDVATTNLELQVRISELETQNYEQEAKIKAQAALILRLKTDAIVTTQAANKVADQFMLGLEKDSQKNTIKKNLILATKNCSVLLIIKTEHQKGGLLSALSDAVATLLKDLQSDLKVLNDLNIKGKLDESKKESAKLKFDSVFSAEFDKLRYQCIPAQSSSTINIFKLISTLNQYIIKGTVIKIDADSLTATSCKTEILQSNLEEKIKSYDEAYQHAKEVQHEILIKFNAVHDDLKSISIALRDYVILIDPRRKFIAPEATYKGVINYMVPQYYQMTTKRKDFFAVPGGHDFIMDEKLDSLPSWIEEKEAISFKFSDPEVISQMSN